MQTSRWPSAARTCSDCSGGAATRSILLLSLTMLARMLLLQSKQFCRGRAHCFSARQLSKQRQRGLFPVKSARLALQSDWLFSTHGLWLFLACKKRTPRHIYIWHRRRFKPLPPKFTRPVRCVQSCLPSHLHVYSLPFDPFDFTISARLASPEFGGRVLDKT